jgi:hypothetical protein
MTILAIHSVLWELRLDMQMDILKILIFLSVKFVVMNAELAPLALVNVRVAKMAIIYLVTFALLIVLPPSTKDM